MFFHMRGGRDFPPDHHLTGLHDHKAAAWTLTAGMHCPAPRRAHRSMLPDVYPAAVAPAENRPPLRRRVLDALRQVARVAAGKEAAAILLSGFRAPAVGKSLPATYIAPDEIVS